MSFAGFNRCKMDKCDGNGKYLAVLDELAAVQKRLEETEGQNERYREDIETLRKDIIELEDSVPEGDFKFKGFTTAQVNFMVETMRSLLNRLKLRNQFKKCETKKDFSDLKKEVLDMV